MIQKKRKVISIGVVLLFLAGLCLGTSEIAEQRDRREVVVAILDTGYSGENSRVMSGITTIEKEDGMTDGNGHGTRITEIILEGTEEQVYVMPIKIADFTGRSSEQAACLGMEYAIENKVDIIHMSLNMCNLGKESKLSECIHRAIEAGIKIVTSAGNYGENVASVFPANMEEVIVVSAINEKDEICNYSNYGSTVDFAAYGCYGGETGTSYSAARVTGLLANEYSNGGDLNTLKQKAIDAGVQGKDDYYGYGILKNGAEVEYEEIETKYYGKTQNDLGYKILGIDWKKEATEVLDKYFAETHFIYVGMYLSKLEPAELEELKRKTNILNSDVLVQDFEYSDEAGSYIETVQYEENFVEHALKKYQEHKEELTISAEWLMLKNNGYFAISSENRADIFYFQIKGFSYTTINSESPWFSLFDPQKLSVTRTIIKQTTDFGEVQVAGFDKFLCSGNAFATKYADPETGEQVEYDNFYAIDSGTDTGSLNYGLSIIIEGYHNEREGYHTSEEDIILMPYDYTHAYEEYSFEDYKEPLKYTFTYYIPSTNSTEYADTPQKVIKQEKNFKKLIKTNQTIWYNGVYKEGYDYSDVDNSLSLKEKMDKYLESYAKKKITNVNMYSKESSLYESGFTINADLMASLGIQWNDGETPTVALRNDVPEYNFPLVINRYEIIYDGNGATAGGMAPTAMEYNQTKNLEENQYSRQGYVFRGWSRTPDGDVEYADKQEVCNLTVEHDVSVILYAVWDEFPWIIAEDLYFPLSEAQNGEITYEVLINRAIAKDKEAGGVVLPGIDEEKGTMFVLLDYEAGVYTALLQEAVIPLTYQVTDCAGSTYETQINVNIVDTAAKEEKPKGYTRFISEKYYGESYENGGLEEVSIWYLNTDYVNSIEKAFENSRSGTPMISMSFSSEDIDLMKAFVAVNGIGNDKRPDGLEAFFEQFLSGNERIK